MKQVDAQLGYLDDSDDPATEKVAAQTTLPSGGGDTSYLVRLSRTIRESLSQLDVHVQQKTDSGTDSGTRDNDGKSQLIEQMAFLIHDSMSASARRYHNVQHVVSPTQRSAPYLVAAHHTYSPFLCTLEHLKQHARTV